MSTIRVMPEPLNTGTPSQQVMGALLLNLEKVEDFEEDES